MAKGTRKKDGIIVAGVLLVFGVLVGFQNCAPLKTLVGKSDPSKFETPTPTQTATPLPCTITGTCPTLAAGTISLNNPYLSGATFQATVAYGAPSNLEPVTCSWQIYRAGSPVKSIAGTVNQSTKICTSVLDSVPTLSGPDPNQVSFTLVVNLIGQQNTSTSSSLSLEVVKALASATPTGTPTGSPPPPSSQNARVWFNMSDPTGASSDPNACVGGYTRESWFSATAVVDSDLDSTGAIGVGWLSACTPVDRPVRLYGTTVPTENCPAGYIRMGYLKVKGSGVVYKQLYDGATSETALSSNAYVYICAKDPSFIKIVAGYPATSTDVACPSNYELAASASIVASTATSGITEVLDSNGGTVNSSGASRMALCFLNNAPALNLATNLSANPFSVFAGVPVTLSWQNTNTVSVFPKVLVQKNSIRTTLSPSGNSATYTPSACGLNGATVSFKVALCSTQGTVGCRVTGEQYFDCEGTGGGCNPLQGVICAQ